LGLKKHVESQRHKFTDVLNYYKEQDCELLAYKYENNVTKMWFVCKCGRLGYNNFKRFKEGTRCQQLGCSQVKNKIIIDWDAKSI